MRNLLACHLSGQAWGTLYPVRAAGLIRELSTLPGLAGQLLKDAWRGDRYRQLAERFHTYHNFRYLERGINYPIAREGGLKFKEISYIQAEGYPAGEMKHGQIALIDANMPTIVLAAQNCVYDSQYAIAKVYEPHP
jgi:glucosamine--fructose-6-phosphate aminotransferase (isomerizing)